jgi:UTP--glucose-1-phosphate uridylyltransferase
MADEKYIDEELFDEADALDFEGERFDMGAKIGFLKANVVRGAEHPETKEEFKAFLKAFVKTLD